MLCWRLDGHFLRCLFVCCFNFATWRHLHWYINIGASLKISIIRNVVTHANSNLYSSLWFVVMISHWELFAYYRNPQHIQAFTFDSLYKTSCGVSHKVWYSRTVNITSRVKGPKFKPIHRGLLSFDSLLSTQFVAWFPHIFREPSVKSTKRRLFVVRTLFLSLKPQ